MTEWRTDAAPVDYETALAVMEARAEAIRDGTAAELVWLLEHPPLYTAGTSAKAADLISNGRFPVYQTGRGGQYTYHGPGQRVGYVMLDLKDRQQVPDIKRYVWQLEEWIIRSLAHFDVKGERRSGRVGIWVVTSRSPFRERAGVRDFDNQEPSPNPLPEGRGLSGEAKIAAIGVRIRRWVTMHGIAINVDPDLSHYDGIVPCGISEHGVTSLAKLLGRKVAMGELDAALKLAWDDVFQKHAVREVV